MGLMAMKEKCSQITATTLCIMWLQTRERRAEPSVYMYMYHRGVCVIKVGSIWGLLSLVL